MELCCALLRGALSIADDEEFNLSRRPTMLQLIVGINIRVQEMVRTLDRRAEAIKGHFQNDLRKVRRSVIQLSMTNKYDEDSANHCITYEQKDVTERRQTQQIHDLETYIEEQKRRIEELQQRHDDVNKRNSHKINELQEQCMKLQEERGQTIGEHSLRMDALLMEERAKHTRLETENSLLQKELGKKEVSALIRWDSSYKYEFVC
jgi:hypothetical protein